MKMPEEVARNAGVVRCAELLEGGRVSSAHALLTGLVAMGKHPVLTYQLGAIHFRYLGDGERARQLFQRTMVAPPSSNADADAWARAAAAESLMLLSLSYAEHEQWAGELERLQPQNPILGPHRQQVRAARHAGRPWAMVLLGNALTHHNPRDPAGPRRSSEAAATWQLLVNHRKELRVDRTAFHRAAVQYAAELVAHASACHAVMIARGPEEPAEIQFILEPVLPVLRDLRAAHPADADLRDLAATVDQLLHRDPSPSSSSSLRAPGPLREPTDTGIRAVREGERITTSRLGCLLLLLGPVLGALGGRRWPALAWPWNAAAGAAAGLVLAAAAAMTLQLALSRHRRR